MEGDAELECCLGYYLFDFERTSSCHLEFLGSPHMEIHHIQPYLIPDFPWSELGGNSLPHFLLSHFVDSLGIILSRGEITKSFLQVGQESLA